MTHALAALLAGHFSEAFADNALLFILGPVLGPYLIFRIFLYVKTGETHISRAEKIFLVVLLVTAVLYGIIRNL